MHPEIAQMIQHWDSVIALLDAQVQRMRTEAFAVSDESGTVEATVNGQLRLTDLRIDPRILGLGAREVSGRINEALGAAAEFTNECIEAEVGELEDEVVEALVKLRNLPPAK
ncbi:YbaB/EbfC family nucleoid-associated protein [Mycobacterium sp. Aquia_216]|uniref:YbaB/EbfC family nucleoid-associated protein n=1 Tax=Mycobacterium sp. Aquia_216 TaxID=2991729 RepID=UPI00227B9559|nr:YbaB/EbfC family nucleoid-associated protein [Mycobacterium sp. Aquia_216]WAJ45808.1 YbaB/EbfC family nucleoid-associated protein [Mycobacterium sp. Aquia_216]